MQENEQNEEVVDEVITEGGCFTSKDFTYQLSKKKNSKILFEYLHYSFLKALHLYTPELLLN